MLTRRILIIIFIFISKSLLLSMDNTQNTPIILMASETAGCGGTYIFFSHDFFINPASVAIVDKVQDEDNFSEYRRISKRKEKRFGILDIFSIRLALNTDIFNKFDYVMRLYDIFYPFFKSEDQDYDIFSYISSLSSYQKSILSKLTRELSYINLSNIEQVDLLNYFNPKINSYFNIHAVNSIQFTMEMGLIPDFNFKYGNILDLIFSTGFGIRVPRFENLILGLGVKIAYRTGTLASGDLNDFMGMFSDIISGQIDITKIMSSFLGATYFTGVSNIYSFSEIFHGIGFGVDIGTAYEIIDGLFAEMTLSDIVSYFFYSSSAVYIKPTIRLGISYKIPFYIKNIIEDIRAGFNISDVIYTRVEKSYNFLLHLHTGIQASFFFHFLTLRFGLNQGYPSIGAKIDINSSFFRYLPFVNLVRPDKFYKPVFKKSNSNFKNRNFGLWIATILLAPFTYSHLVFDINYYGEETGYRPGERPAYYLDVKFSLSYSY